MREMKQMIHEVAKRVRVVCGSYYAPVVNCTAFEEEVCAEMLKMFPNAPFAACWHARGDGTELWTLRSAGKCDVGQIARRMEGHGDATHARFIDPAIDMEEIIAERDALIEKVFKLQGE